MKEILNKLSPKATFIGGAVGGILVLCTIGFFILLSVVLGGGGIKTADSIGTAPSPEPAAVLPTVGNGNIKLAAITDKDWYKGGKNAEITIVEFSDAECPFCKRFHAIMNQVIAEYGDKVKWVYKHAPLDSLHRKARKEAEAFECAGEVGGNEGFWDYADRLFEVTPSNDGLDPDQLPQIAEDIGLNRGKFENCLASGKYAAKVQQHLDEATSAGLRGTPYSVLVSGDKTIPISGAQPFEQVKAMIESVL